MAWSQGEKIAVCHRTWHLSDFFIWQLYIVKAQWHTVPLDSVCICSLEDLWIESLGTLSLHLLQGSICFLLLLDLSNSWLVPYTPASFCYLTALKSLRHKSYIFDLVLMIPSFHLYQTRQLLYLSILKWSLNVLVDSKVLPQRI